MKRINIWWEELDDDARKKVVKTLNYLLSSIPLTFLFYFIFRPALNVIILYFCVFVFLVYMEYYYKWFRRDFDKEDIDDKIEEKE